MDVHLNCLDVHLSCTFDMKVSFLGNQVPRNTLTDVGDEMCW